MGGAGNVSESYRAHGYHEEIYCVPIAYWMGVGEVWEVARVLQLDMKMEEEEEGDRVWNTNDFCNVLGHAGLNGLF